MSLRITTWNVNGIRNPFGYQPWRDKRTFEAMFDILEADIVVFQETKIQRKDLRDDMVLVPGFDCYWSLPKHKKGYSGVVIYTRNEKCAPIRAEEGITGVLTPPNTATSFRDLPDDEQIGGYPNVEQLTQSEYDAATLDSEGRCVILEFPAFVLIGTYCPAERDETRTHFRTAFLQVLDSRIRNLVKLGKRVVWTGDLNISREQLDTAKSEEAMRQEGIDADEWISTPARRMFNQLLVGGRVVGERDEGREQPCMWDICRAFHPGRKGMFTCWETKVNARPGNYGARIDYVVCSHDMKDWFSDSNIQEGLHGSDHCPVYAVFKDKVEIDGTERHIIDLVNPEGMFQGGVRQQQWSAKNMLPMSGKLIPEFDRRRNIKDMFASKPPGPKAVSLFEENSVEFRTISPAKSPLPKLAASTNSTGKRDTSPQKQSMPAGSPPRMTIGKRSRSETNAPTKRVKSSQESNGKGQQTLKGFFKAKESPVIEDNATVAEVAPVVELPICDKEILNDRYSPSSSKTDSFVEDEAASFETRQSWGKLFAKPVAPKCEHEEPCKTMLTKKPGANQGRSFWMCNRPLGPSGKQERGSQWRCNTFIWCSDWNTRDEG